KERKDVVETEAGGGPGRPRPRTGRRHHGALAADRGRALSADREADERRGGAAPADLVDPAARARQLLPARAAAEAPPGARGGCVGGGCVRPRGDPAARALAGRGLAGLRALLPRAARAVGRVRAVRHDRLRDRDGRCLRDHRRGCDAGRRRCRPDRDHARVDARSRRLLRRPLLVRRAQPAPSAGEEAVMGSGAERSLEQEAAEDVFFGQVVMIWARWFLIASGAVFFLWTAKESTQLALGVLPIVGLMAVNFCLHGRYFLERPSNVLQITTASAL